MTKTTSVKRSQTNELKNTESAEPKTEKEAYAKAEKETLERYRRRGPGDDEFRGRIVDRLQKDAKKTDSQKVAEQIKKFNDSQDTA